VTTPTSASAVKLDNAEVIEGRLAFKSQDELYVAYAKLSKNQSELENFEAQFKGYTSQKQAFENFSSADLDRTNGDLTPYQDYVVRNVTKGEVSYDEVVAPKIYSHLVSAEGLLQIGDKVYKFVSGFIYEFNVSEMAAYKANKNNLGAIPNVQKMDFVVKRQKLNVRTAYASSELADVYEIKGRINPSNNNIVDKDDRRAIAYLSTSEPCCFFAYTSDVILTNQIKGFWGWTGEKTELKFNGTVYYGTIQYGGGITPKDDSPRTAYSFEPNSSKASLQLDWNRSGFPYVYLSNTSVTYTTIKQTRPVSRANLSVITIAFP
jgi:hypothetical protein